MKDGRTAREHILAGARRDPVAFADAVADVTPHPIPPCAALAVHAFETLSATRGGGFSGPRPLTLGDVDHLTRVLGLPLSPQEARWVLVMDQAFCEAVAA